MVQSQPPTMQSSTGDPRVSMAKLSGIVIVTGAASGLGREAALHFADCGATVVAVDINEAGLQSIASERIHTVTADVTRDSACRSIAERAAGLGKLTGLLNSAGIELCRHSTGPAPSWPVRAIR